MHKARYTYVITYILHVMRNGETFAHFNGVVLNLPMF